MTSKQKWGLGLLAIALVVFFVWRRRVRAVQVAPVLPVTSAANLPSSIAPVPETAAPTSPAIVGLPTS